MLPYYSTFSLEFEKKSMALKGVVIHFHRNFEILGLDYVT